MVQARVVVKFPYFKLAGKNKFSCKQGDGLMETINK
jgi:hypothetical protein